jgi:hypothetical protein
MAQQQQSRAGEAVTTIAGVLALWAAPRCDAGELPRRVRAGALRNCRLTWAPTDYTGPALWTSAGRLIGPRDLPGLVLFVRISSLGWAPSAQLVERARAAGYTIRAVLELPHIPEPRPEKAATTATASARPRRRRRRPSSTAVR